MGMSIAEIKKEVWASLQPMQCVYLATGEADQPRVRPVTLLNLEEKFWIATSPRSAKARQILRNPNVEFCLPLTAECGNGYVRVAGVASMVTDAAVKERIGPQVPFLQEHWAGVEDPEFCLIRITRVEIEYLKPGEKQAATFMV